MPFLMPHQQIHITKGSCITAKYECKCASVTKPYSLVPVTGQQCPTPAKVSVGLVSHWPGCLSTHARTHTCTRTQLFYSSLDFVWDNPGELVPEGTFCIFWIFWCKIKITQADTPTVQMDRHPIQTNWCPHLCYPHHFYAGCPSWHNPPNLSWLGTGTKYAMLACILDGLVWPCLSTCRLRA